MICLANINGYKNSDSSNKHGDFAWFQQSTLRFLLLNIIQHHHLQDWPAREWLPKNGIPSWHCFFWWRGWFWKTLVFVVLNCQSNPSLPELVCLGNIPETLEPSNTWGQKSLFPVTFPFNQSKNGDTMGNQEVTLLLEKSLWISTCKKIIMSDQSHFFLHQLTISPLVKWLSLITPKLLLISWITMLCWKNPPTAVPGASGGVGGAQVAEFGVRRGGVGGGGLRLGQRRSSGSPVGPGSLRPQRKRLGLDGTPFLSSPWLQDSNGCIVLEVFGCTHFRKPPCGLEIWFVDGTWFVCCAIHGIAWDFEWFW